MNSKLEEETIQHSAEQREELLVVNRALLAFVKRIGFLLAGLVIAGVLVAIADHYKLQSVENAVVALTSTVKAQQERNEIFLIWKAGIDVELLELKTKLLNLETKSNNSHP